MKKILLTSSLILLAGWAAWAQSCPNGDFENWNIYPYSVPDSGWFNSNPQSVAKADSLTVWPVTGVVGQAVHIQTAIIGTDTLQAYVINTLGDPKTGTGGMPYSQQPTSINGYYRYHMVGADSALMIIEFKKAGSVIATTQFAYRNASGDITTFTPFSFPLATIPVVPDSVIIGLASSNLEGTGVQSGSWVELDELSFGGTGITQPIAGGSFDSWVSQSVQSPVGWTAQSNGNGGTGISRSDTHYSGNYSVQLVTQYVSCGSCSNPNQPGELTTGYFTQNNGPAGGLPYTHMIDTVSGYYMYAPAGADTASVQITLTAGGSMISSFWKNLFAASTWTYFEEPIFAPSTPDTIRIDLQSSSWNALTPGSVLNVDYLQLKSQPLPPISVGELNRSISGITAYPNPAVDVLNLAFHGNITSPFEVRIYDLTGRILYDQHYATPSDNVSLPVLFLSAGMYFYQISNAGNLYRGKFLKN